MNNRAFDIISDDDTRRAAAILQHAGRRDATGIDAVVEEAVELNRLVHLVFAQAVLSQTLFPTLASDYGIGCINSYIGRVAARGSDD